MSDTDSMGSDNSAGSASAPEMQAWLLLLTATKSNCCLQR